MANATVVTTMTEAFQVLFPVACMLTGMIIGAWLDGWLRRGPAPRIPMVDDFGTPTTTELKPCAVEYKVGDVVLAKNPRGKAETLTITDITETYDGTGHHLMSGKQIIPTNHIIGGYRP